MSYDSPKDPWAVAKCRGGGEKDYAERLKKAGQDVFVPTVTTTTRPSGKRFPMKVERPRFPAYLFVRAETINYLDPVYQDRRFHGFLKVAHMVAFVSDDIIRALRAWDGCETVPEKPKAPFAKGDVLRVVSGVFGGMEGEACEFKTAHTLMHGYDFPVPSWMPTQNLRVSVQITDLNLLEEYVESAA